MSGAGFGVFMWFVLGGGCAQVCADSRAHIPVKLRDQLRASLLSGSPPWFLSLGLSASLELIM